MNKVTVTLQNETRRKLTLRRRVLSILLKEFGKEGDNHRIYSCADSWCTSQVTTNGVVSYYKAVLRGG